MRRDQLEHVLRCSARPPASPAISACWCLAASRSWRRTPRTRLPGQVWASVEADLAFYDDPDLDKTDSVDMHLGEDSQFHQEFGYYAQGVEVSTAVLPRGWKERTVTYRPTSAEPAVAVCLDPHDLVVAKLVAQREKDRAFALALLRVGLVDHAILVERAHELEVPMQRAIVVRWLGAWAAQQ